MASDQRPPLNGSAPSGNRRPRLATAPPEPLNDDEFALGGECAWPFLLPDLAVVSAPDSDAQAD